MTSELVDRLRFAHDWLLARGPRYHAETVSLAADALTRHPAPLSEENVEVVARAIACARDKRLYGIERSPDEGWDFLTDYARSEFISDARAAIAALSTTQESNR